MTKQKNTTENTDVKNEPHVIVDDIKYHIKDMTDSQKLLYAHVENVNRKINSAKYNLEELQVCHQAYGKALVASLKGESDESG